MSSRSIEREAPIQITRTGFAAMGVVEPDAATEESIDLGDLGPRSPPLVLKTMRHLLRDILTGRYQPGDRIREVEVSERLGISRAPVREALRVLEQDGLVEIVPFKGARVTALQPDQIVDLFDLLGTLLGAVARFAVRHATDAELERHSANIAKYAKWAEAGHDFVRLVDLAYQLGTDLGLCCGNPMAAAMLRKLGRQAYGQHRLLEPVPRRWQQQMVTRFRRLDAGLRARSELRAEKAARRLVQHTLQLLLQHVGPPANRAA